MTSTTNLGAKLRGAQTPLLLGLALALVTLAVYWQVGGHQFVNIDDDSFVVNNVHVATGLTADNLLWALSPQPGLGWHPVTWLSHMLDVELYGLNPRGHHLTSVFLHIAATVLLFTLLVRTTSAPWRSAFVAALFALHPLHVESVAWVAERRDVLSACFGFLTLWLYVEYVASRRLGFYLGALLAFVLGLMSKPIVVTLPVIMLLLDAWPLQRYDRDAMSPESQGRSRIAAGLIPLVKEKLPFFACALVAALITLSVPYKEGAYQIIVTPPLVLRIENAIVAYVTYLSKTLWPTDLTVFYPFPKSIPLWQVSGALLVLLAITLTAICARRRHPYLFVGWFWYLVMLVPVLGLIPFGPHAMADRYTYLSLVGPLIAVAWGVPALTAKLPRQRIMLALLAGVAIMASTVLTSLQLRHWQNSMTLFQRALEVSPANSLAHTNLAVALLDQGQIIAAADHLQQAIEIDPQDLLAHYNLGLIYLEQGHFDEAITEIFKSSKPGFDEVEVYLRLGNELYMQGRFSGAVKFYRRVLERQPDSLEARNNLGAALFRQEDFAGAIGEYEKILEKYPDHIDARYNLALALEQQKRLDKTP